MAEETSEKKCHDFACFSAYLVELENDSGEVENGVLILRGELSSDFEGVVPLVMYLQMALRKYGHLIWGGFNAV